MTNSSAAVGLSRTLLRACFATENAQDRKDTMELGPYTCSRSMKTKKAKAERAHRRLGIGA